MFSVVDGVIAKIIFGLLAVAVLPIVGQPQLDERAVARAKDLTVMLDCSLGVNTVRGAGFIFSVQDDRIYIATANHLVREGLRAARSIKVRFQWRPERDFDAELFYKYDVSLDLAVLSVRGLAETGVDGRRLEFDVLGDVAALASKSPVWPLGFPNGVELNINAAPNRIVHLGAEKLEYGPVHSEVRSGDSLLDQNTNVIGLIRQDRGPNAEASRIELILDQLTRWNYRVELRLRPTGDRFSDVLRTMTFHASTSFRSLVDLENPKKPQSSLPGGNCAFETRFDLNSIVCDMHTSQSAAEAEEVFSRSKANVGSILIGWERREIPAAGGPGLHLQIVNFRSTSGHRVQVEASESHGKYVVCIRVFYFPP